MIPVFDLLKAEAALRRAMQQFAFVGCIDICDQIQDVLINIESLLKEVQKI